MKRTTIAILGIGVLLLLLVAGAVWARSSGNYAIDWEVMSGGGAPASGGNVTLDGSLGQTAVGPSTSSSYSLGAGYWTGMEGEQRIYLPLVLRSR
jgi:hypothetical protein